MKHFKRTIGWIFILIACAGILLSIAGVIFIWQARQNITQKSLQTLQLMEDTLNATQQGLTLASSSLDNAAESAQIIQNSILASGEGFTSTVEILNATATMLNTDLPQTIRTTQTALANGQNSAALIDNTLKLIASIPFYTGPAYSPENTLSSALAQISLTLDPLPQTFDALSDNMQVASASLQVLQTDTAQIAIQIGELSTNLTEAQTILSDYQANLTQIQTEISTLKTSLPRAITNGAWVLTLIILWIGNTQIGLLTQGFDWAHQENTPAK
ncbi:MAG: hypothetical protein OHK0052_07450 [Anaerolineales bacterium]